VARARPWNRVIDADRHECENPVAFTEDIPV
jgi:hypothetical protein